MIVVRTILGRAYGGALQPAPALRSEGTFNRRTYDRQYYHRVRKLKGGRQVRSLESLAVRRQARKDYYYNNLERERAKARERMRLAYARRKASSA